MGKEFTAGAALGSEAIRLSVEIPASRELLWTYLSTAAGLATWQADEVEGDLASGSFSLRWPDLGARLDLGLDELDAGAQLSLRAGSSVLSLRAEAGRVELIHQGLDPPDDLMGFESSWQTALGLLSLAVRLHPGKRREVAWLAVEVETPAELLHYYFTEPKGLGTWLGTLDSSLVAGERYRLSLFGGITLSGTVLFSGRDVCLHVEEWNHGALVFRSVPGPGGSRVVALGLSTWQSTLPGDIVLALRAALHHLSTAALLCRG